MRASLIVIFKCWLKTKPRALYIWEKGTTFNPKLRFVVFHSIAFSTKPNIIGLPTKTMFQPENSNTLYNMAITAVCCSDLQGLIKAGISGAKADVERCKQQVRRDSYLSRRCFDSLENVLNRCDEEGYALLVRLLHAALHAPKQPGWDQFKVDCYYRYAGEVEARNAAERTLGLRKGILAESTEEFSRDAQLLALSYSVSNLTRHVWERLCNRLSFC